MKRGRRFLTPKAFWTAAIPSPLSGHRARISEHVPKVPKREPRMNTERQGRKRFSPCFIREVPWRKLISVRPLRAANKSPQSRAFGDPRRRLLFPAV